VLVFFILLGLGIAYTSNDHCLMAFARARALGLVPGVWVCASGPVVALLVRDAAKDAAKTYFLPLIFFPDQALGGDQLMDTPKKR
jgi:hypothetical protein